MLKPLLTLALLFPAITHARIGETPEECAKRYGLPAERLCTTEMPILSFQKAGVVTTCYFAEGKCAAICFALITPVRADLQDSKQNTPTFTLEQTAALLDPNKGGQEWTSFPEIRGITMHHTQNAARQAMTSGTHIIIQETRNILNRKELVTPEAVSEAIKGF